MEHMQRNIPVRHPLDKSGRRPLVIIGRKGGGQPQAKGPGRRQRRFTGQFRIFRNGSLRGRAVNHIVIESLPLHGKLQTLHLFAGYLIGGVPFIVQKHTVPLVGNIKRNVFVCDFARCPAVLIPHFNHLAVLHKRGVSLAQSIDALIHINSQLLHHISFSCIPVCHMSHIAVSCTGQLPFPVKEADSPAVWPLVNDRSRMAALIADFILRLLNRHMRGGLMDPGEGAVVCSPLKMSHGNLNHIFHWAGKADRKHPQV